MPALLSINSSKTQTRQALGLLTLITAPQLPFLHEETHNPREATTSSGQIKWDGGKKLSHIFHQPHGYNQNSQMNSQPTSNINMGSFSAHDI